MMRGRTSSTSTYVKRWQAIKIYFCPLLNVFISATKRKGTESSHNAFFWVQWSMGDDQEGGHVVDCLHARFIWYVSAQQCLSRNY